MKIIGTSIVAMLLSTVAAPAGAQAVAGDWEGIMNTPGAPVPLKLTLTARGDTLGGMVHRAAGDVKLTGRIKGDSVQLQYTIQYGDNPLLMTLRGRVVGDSLGGIVDFGGNGEDQFGVRRVKPVPARPAPPERPRRQR